MRRSHDTESTRTPRFARSGKWVPEPMSLDLLTGEGDFESVGKEISNSGGLDLKLRWREAEKRKKTVLNQVRFLRFFYFILFLVSVETFAQI